MNYHTTFAADLNVSPDDFVAAWNDTPKCRDLAEAQLVRLTSRVALSLL